MTPNATTPATITDNGAIYDNLPVGVEIYNNNGLLIEINSHEMKVMGINNKSDILGICIFDHPLMLPEWREKLIRGEDLEVCLDYDFSLVKDYYKTSNNSVRNMTISIKVLHDSQGEIERYLVVSQDNTNWVQLKQKYENLYNQNSVILNSLPVSVGVYAPDGELRYFNDGLPQLFDVDLATFDNRIININNSPFPQPVKDAITEQKEIHTTCAYDFTQASNSGHIPTQQSNTRMIDCSGRPIFASDGTMESYVYIMSDVTESIESEEFLRQNKLKTEMAMTAADITVWEYDVLTGLFFSENEPMNHFDSSKYLSMEQYVNSLHPDDIAKAMTIAAGVIVGEDISFRFEGRFRFPNIEDWQYCTLNGSPFQYDNSGKVTKYIGTRKNDTNLQKQKILQEKILNNIPIPIHIKDIEDDYRFLFCNDESHRMFGTTTESTSFDVMSKEAVEHIRKSDLEVFNTGIPYTGLEHLELKDGRSYDTIVSKSIFEDGGKRLLLNVRWDQSLQNDLMRRAKLLSITLDAMGAFTWFYEPDKQLISYGEGYEKTGAKILEMNTLDRYVEAIHPDDREPFINSLNDLIEQDSAIWRVESRMDFNGDGKYKWWEVRGLIETTIQNDLPHKHMFGMTICIDDHKKTELTLRSNQKRLDHLVTQNDLVLNNTNSGLAYITTDFIVQWENISKCSTSLSYEAYKMGEHCYKSAHNRTEPCENCVLKRAMQSRQLERINFELEDNQMVEVFATPVFRDDDTMDGIVIRVDNITERENMISELRQAKAQAEESDKLKSAFLANMSHEIRTPLNAIIGFSELLMSATDQESEEYIQIINTNNELLLKLINDILDLSKIEAGSVELKYELFDLSEYFDGMTLSMKQRVNNPNVRLLSVNPHASCVVNLDRNRIAQIMTNYVTNAIKYTPSGFIEMGYHSTESGIKIYVKDSGIGISDHKKEKVFHRFEKLDEFAQGTGLGLSICKAIAESMGGSVGFESNIDSGSTFWAELPCIPYIVSNPEAHTAENQDDNRQNCTCTANSDHRIRTILVAEDINSNYILLSAMLNKQYNLLHAHNGREAIELIQNNKVDIVLMDMKMPYMDGMTATRTIRELGFDTPIIALTAHAFESDKQAALKIGCNEYLIKPVDKAKLISVLRKYCVEELLFR